jgi:hypothetical protein
MLCLSSDTKASTILMSRFAPDRSKMLWAPRGKERHIIFVYLSGSERLELRLDDAR